MRSRRSSRTFRTGLYANRWSRKATMQKLMTWEMKCGPSTPKVFAVSSPIFARSAPSPAKMMNSCIRERDGAGHRVPRQFLPDEEYGVEDDRLREGDRQDRLHEDLRRRPRIAPDGFGSLHADEPDADSGTERRQANMHVA